MSNFFDEFEGSTLRVLIFFYGACKKPPQVFVCIFVQIKSLEPLRAENAVVKDLFNAYDDLKNEFLRTRKEVIAKVAKVEECKDGGLMRSFLGFIDPEIKRCVCGGKNFVARDGSHRGSVGVRGSVLMGALRKSCQ